MINLQFTIEQINQILALLGQLPFNASNNLINDIVQQAQPQAEAIEAKRKEVEAALEAGKAAE